MLVSFNVMAEWVNVSSSENDDTYFDFSTKRNVGNITRIWQLRDFKTPQSIGEKTYLSSKSLYEYDCLSIRHRVQTIVVYSQNMGRGDNVASESGNSPWSDIVPDTVGYTDYKKICNKNRK